MELLSSLRGSRKKGGGGGDVKKSAQGIGEGPFSLSLPPPPFRHLPLRAPRYRNSGLFIPFLLVSHRSSAGFVQILLGFFSGKHVSEVCIEAVADPGEAPPPLYFRAN